ncbi:hypothetical protein EIK77_005450 [Talaromyces pinophilus]|nr:hypothetical protein EIK77_005450 [Talaromyces pinophilus]
MESLATGMEDIATAVKFAPECDPPPYSPPPYSPPSQSPQAGSECVLSVDGGIITVIGKKVRIQPWENALSQKWRIESDHSRFGFRNQSSGRLLGVHYFTGNVVASTKKLNHWKLFDLIALEVGFVFRIPARFIWTEVFLVQPYSARRLQASGRQDGTGMIRIQSVHHWTNETGGNLQVQATGG